MADADRRTIGAGTPVEVLMDRAGRSVAWAVRRQLDGVYGCHAVVACGKGNNGGDGLVAARVLTGWGARVDVTQLAHPPHPTDLAPAPHPAALPLHPPYRTPLTRPPHPPPPC